MADSEISLIKFNTINFHSVLINSKPFHPITTILVKLLYCLIASETKQDPKTKAELDVIYERTHEKVGLPLPIVELAVFKNLDRGLNRDVEIGKKTFALFQLYQYLDEVSLRLSQMVIEIAKRYSVDLPMLNTTQRQNVDLGLV